MTNRRIWRFVATACAIATIGAAALTGQGSQTAASADAAAIVEELRALRADLLRTATAGVEAQLLVARLSIQEQRIVALNRQLSTVQASIAAGTRRDENGEVIVRSMSKRGLANYNQLRSQEEELGRQMTEEQGRWTYFSTRLDELERSLAQIRR